MTRSPNFGPRRDNATPDIVVLHYTAMADWRRARDWLCTPSAEVSAHYIISEQGEIVQLVEEEMRAWHAGAGAWGAVEDVNSHSIGIELSNNGASPFAAPLMDGLEQLLSGILDRWAIPAHRVIAHSDLAPGRKVDPGARFDWARLVRGGMAVQAYADKPALVDPALFKDHLRTFGYTAPVSEDALLAAFRLRHRQGHSGPLDGIDCALAADLAARFPIDRHALTS